jgi:tetratricopeptide (TPR) repeat protein
MGVVLLLQKNWADAIPPLVHANELEPGNLQGHIWLAQAYSNSGQVNEAKTEFNRAIDIDPNNADAAKGLDLIRKYEAQKAMKAAGGQKAADTSAAPATPKAGKTAKGADPAASPKTGGAVKK